MAYLGKYYAHKIAGATELGLLRETLDADHHENVARELNLSAHYWRLYTASAVALYSNPLWTNRVGYVDWRKNYRSVLYDLTTTGSTIDIPSIAPTPGGTILEAEAAETSASPGNEIPGFTGDGYVDLKGAEGTGSIEWTFHAPRSGTHILEFRYVERWNSSHMPAGLIINGESVDDLIMWLSGSPETWVWDRATVQLEAGANTIRLAPSSSPRIDHLNVIDTGY